MTDTTVFNPPEGVSIQDVPVAALDRVTRGQMGYATRALSLVVDGIWSIVVPRPGTSKQQPDPDVCGPCAAGDHVDCLGGCACVTERIPVDG